MNETPTHDTSSERTQKRNIWVPITVATIGGAVLLGTVATAAVAGVLTAKQNPDSDPQQYSIAAAGVTELDVSAEAAQMVVQCNTDQNTNFVLEADRGSQKWEMRLDGDTVRVAPVKAWATWLPFIGGNPWSDAATVTLTLPTQACDGTLPLDAEYEIGAGELQVMGSYAELDLSVGAGSVTATGTVRDLTVDIAAGDGEFDLKDVHTANISVAAGDLTGRFTGLAPNELDVEVAVGDASLVLPDERYAVTSEVSVGDFENGLRTDPSATMHRVSVEVAAGSLTLLPEPRR